MRVNLEVVSWCVGDQDAGVGSSQTGGEDLALVLVLISILVLILVLVMLLILAPTQIPNFHVQIWYLKYPKRANMVFSILFTRP